MKLKNLGVDRCDRELELLESRLCHPLNRIFCRILKVALGLILTNEVRCSLRLILPSKNVDLRLQLFWECFLNIFEVRHILYALVRVDKVGLIKLVELHPVYKHICVSRLHYFLDLGWILQLILLLSIFDVKFVHKWVITVWERMDKTWCNAHNFVVLVINVYKLSMRNCSAQTWSIKLHSMSILRLDVV